MLEVNASLNAVWPIGLRRRGDGGGTVKESKKEVETELDSAAI